MGRVNAQRAGQARDNQRQRLYDAEDAIHGRRPSKAAKKHLVDTQAVSGWRVEDRERPMINAETGDPITFSNGQPAHHTKPMKVPTMQAVQAYVDEVTQASWFQSRWGQRRITVIAGKGSHGGYGQIAISQVHRHSEAVILHEIAHCLTSYEHAHHGPEFAGVLLTLVRYQMGKTHADDLRASFKEHRVRYTMTDVPEPKRPVVTKAQRAAKTRAKENLGDRLGLSTSNQRKVAASIIRAQVKAGLFGASGTKTRAHALATARTLESK